MSTDPKQPPADPRDPNASFTFLHIEGQRRAPRGPDEASILDDDGDTAPAKREDLRTEIQRLFEPARPPSAAPDEAPLVPGYEILSELGRGGMGVVYKARQIVLNRLVALKMILAGGHADREDLQRFVAEAEAVARLQHPNIVQIHEVGRRDNLPYFSLEYVDGGSLGQKAKGVPQSPARAAELIRVLALAIHYAHQHGIIHRDLKPGNILLTSDGQPKITDFGLAKVTESAARKQATRGDQIMGTPSYMAPEQAEKDFGPIGPATDVYSLGAVLYELLTGRPPFLTDQPMMTLLQVLQTDPVAPTRLQPKVPADLETICLKCLHKEPAKRYASGKSLAADLQRFLNGEPIVARPTGWLERSWKWAKRRPAVAALVASLWLVALLGFIGVSWGWNRAIIARHDAEQARDEAQALRQQERQERERAETALYFSRIAQAELQWHNNNVAGAEQLLNYYLPDKDSGFKPGWEWHYLKRLCHAELHSLRSNAGWAHQVAFSQDGRYLAAAIGMPQGLPGQDPSKGPGQLVVCDLGKKPPDAKVFAPESAVWGTAFSHDSQYVAAVTADSRIMVYRLAALDDPPTGWRAPGGGHCVAFSPDGKLLAAGGEGWLRVWEWPSGKPVSAFANNPAGCTSLTFSPDSTLLLTCGAGDLWDVATGQKLRTLHMGGTRGAAFSADGKVIVGVAEDGHGGVWDTATGQRLTRLRAYAGGLNGTAVSPDGSLVATAGVDQAVRLWDLRTGDERRIFRGHVNGGVRAVAFSHDGQLLASAGQDGAVKVWDLRRAAQEYFAIHPAGRVNDLAFSPDGKLLLGAHGGLFRSYAAATARVVGEQHVNLATVNDWEFAATAYRADRRQVAGPTGGDLTIIGIWDSASGQLVQTCKGHTEPVKAVALSPDGRYLASAAWFGRTDVGPERQHAPPEVIVWDAATAQPLHRTPLATGVFCLAFNPTGTHFAVAGGDGLVELWDTATGKIHRTMPLPTKEPIVSVVYSPDGQRVAAMGFYGTGRVWEIASGKTLVALSGAMSSNTLAFAADGTRLVCASRDQVMLWDAATGQEILVLRPMDTRRGGDFSFLAKVAISPDGQRIAANYAYSDQILVWDTAKP